MSRIQGRFAQLRARGRKALIPFVTAGDPSPALTVALMHEMVSAGADIIELGIPFSDPMADGPVIQRASERALAAGMGLRRVLDLVAEFRSADPDTPVVLMGYLNPIEVTGYEAFAEAAAGAGADAVIIVDLPPEEAEELVQALAGHDLDTIFLVAPTTTEARMRLIAEHGSGFIYYVSLKGVTGSSRLDVSSVQEKVAALRRASDLPVGVGFGIRDAESAARVARVADAVVVGSAVVSRVEALAGEPEAIAGSVAELLRDMRQAMDAGEAAAAGAG